MFSSADVSELRRCSADCRQGIMPSRSCSTPRPRRVFGALCGKALTAESAENFRGEVFAARRDTLPAAEKSQDLGHGQLHEKRCNPLPSFSFHVLSTLKDLSK